MTASAHTRIVIIGAGFGGLEAARALAKAPVEVTIIDRQNHHCFQPLLYQVATAVISPADIAWPIRGILRRQQNARVVMGTVIGIDETARVVHADEIDLPYDYLVLSTGVTHSYFGHPDWEESAPGLKTLTDAIEVRRRILLAFEHAETAEKEKTGGDSSPSSSSAAAPPASRWRAPSPRSRGRRSASISAASIRAPRASC